MKPMLQIRTALISSLLLVGATAWGATGAQGKSCGHGAGRFFERLDKDGDGKVTIAELPDHLRPRLAKADANADGVLTRQELKTAHEARREAMKKQADTNGDGRVSKDERRAAHQKLAEARFAEQDKNHDGLLTAEEAGPRAWRFLSAADGNKDGKVSKDEIRAAMANGTLKPHRGRGHHPERGGAKS